MPGQPLPEEELDGAPEAPELLRRYQLLIE
jgi:hypothetical protein